MFKQICIIITCALIFAGSAFAWVEGTQPVGLTLPYSGTIAAEGFAFRIINTGSGTGGYFQVNNSTSNNPAIVAVSNGSGPSLRASATGPGPAADFIGDVQVDGDITREYTTGTSNNAVPIAYGYIKPDGSIGKATPNVQSAWNAGAECYEITIAGENYLFDQYVTVVTPNLGMATSVMPAIYSSPGKLLVYLYTADHNRIPGPFYFITFKP